MASATNTTLGTIKLAGDLAGSNDAALPQLTPTGVVSGVYTNPTLTIDTKGRVTSASNGSAVDVYNLPNASTSSPGVVKVGSGLTMSGDTVSAVIATTSTPGVVRAGTGLLVNGSGVMTVDPAVYPSLVNGGTFSGSISTTIVSSTVSGTVTLDGRASNTFNLSLTGNISFAIPTNITQGAVYYIVLRQDATGSRTVTWPQTGMRFEGSSTLSTAANSIDVLRLIIASGAAPGGAAFKTAVRVATTGNGLLSSGFANGSIVDGVTLVTGDRILIKNQTTSTDNGIYTVNASGAPTRASDWIDTSTAVLNAVIPVTAGTANAGLYFKVLTPTTGTITPGTTAVSFDQFVLQMLGKLYKNFT